MTKKTHSCQVALNVDVLLAENGYSMDELETRLGISKGYIARCRTGKKKLSIDTCIDISKIFNVPLNELVSNKIEKRGIKNKINHYQSIIKALENELSEVEGE